MDIIVVGAGEAFTKHWRPAFLVSKKFQIVGGADTDSARVKDLRQVFPTVRWTTERLQPRFDGPEAAVLILTPDHYPAIEEAVEHGYTRLIVEKPIVSRLSELPRLEALIARTGVKVYAVDQYLPKAMPFQLIGGAMGPSDPMAACIAVRSRAWMGTLADVLYALGTIEGISVAIIESGGFCLPDLGHRPWLRYDRETGGMLADLGTHALAPLIAANYLDPDNVEVVDAKLLRIPDSNAGLVPLELEDEIEMYVSALLLSRGLLIQASFGKVPGGKGIWSLSARFAGGMFYSGLRSDQGSVVTFCDGMSVGFKLTVHPCLYILEEAERFFAGKLPGFDGNMRAVTGSLKICEKIRQKYFGK